MGWLGGPETHPELQRIKLIYLHVSHAMKRTRQLTLLHFQHVLDCSISPQAMERQEFRFSGMMILVVFFLPSFDEEVVFYQQIQHEKDNANKKHGQQIPPNLVKLEGACENFFT